MKEFRKIPENFNELSIDEIDIFSKYLWREFVLSKEKKIDRNQRLKLLQRAYRIWCEKYPNENDDDPDSHLDEIYIELLSQVKLKNP